jgi:putative transposase
LISNLRDYFSFTIKEYQVITLLSVLFENYDYPNDVIIRSDNGSQFTAKKVREYLGLIAVK